jgi:hypothetical protein
VGKRSSIFFLSIHKEKSILALSPADRISQSSISIIKLFCSSLTLLDNEAHVFVLCPWQTLSLQVCSAGIRCSTRVTSNLPKYQRSSLFRPSVTNKINVFMTSTPDLRVRLTNFVAEIFRLRKKWPHPRRGCSGGRGSKGCDPANFNVKETNKTICRRHLHT